MSILRARLQDMLAFAKRKELGNFYERDVQELIEAFAPSSTRRTFAEWLTGMQSAYPEVNLTRTRNLLQQAWDYASLPTSASGLTLDRDTVKCIADELHAFGSMAGPTRSGAAVPIAARLDGWLREQSDIKGERHG